MACACPASLQSPPALQAAAAAAAASLLNGVLSQSIGAAANQCFKLPPRQPALPCPALAWHGRAWLLHYPLHLPLSLPGHLPASPELAMFLIEKRFFNYVSQLLFGAAAAAAAPTAPGWLPCCVPFNLLFLLPFRYPWACRKGSRVATTHNDDYLKKILYFPSHRFRS